MSASSRFRSTLHDLPRRVLVLGSGALRIGQAGEFDYSGTQALKALKEEGVTTVLVNPNVATVQTSHEFADAVYFLPVTPDFVEQVIARERVDAILVAFGGQTALNCGLELARSGVLARHRVRVLGTPLAAIETTEDRQLFVETLSEIGVLTARSRAVRTPDAAVDAAAEIGYPVMLRAGFALGGKGSGVAHDDSECFALAERAFATVPQLLVEEYLGGWKEIEYEVVRDADDHCLTICNMENVDPMGIHTGESIVVAPSQTLTDQEYQDLRDISIEVIRRLGVVGECNIQFAVNPRTWDYRVIEVNARLSRSSALASKATGYPLAYIAAKLALGYRLPDLKNAVTRTTTAFVEPALDYIVCKIPRWDLQKFEGVEQRIGSEMKSVGEVMAIGRTFGEALQKATRMLDIGVDGPADAGCAFTDLELAIAVPSPTRLFAVAEGIARGMSVERLAEITRIDQYFLSELSDLVRIGERLTAARQLHEDSPVVIDRIIEAKRAGFSDRAIGRRLGLGEGNVRQMRTALGIVPRLAQIDSVAAEHPAETNYLYLTYGADRSDVAPSTRRKLLVLGSGCYRIGSSVEFDWCAVNAALEARALGYETLMLNCNPETVSTDYDLCDRLVFDEISLESVLAVCADERPDAVIVSMGGQTANNLALALQENGIPVLGTSPASIDRAESRDEFSALLDELRIDQPRWTRADSAATLEERVNEIGGYPVLVRPSYVLSGAGMRVVWSADELGGFVSQATSVSPHRPVVLSRFEIGSQEIEFDAVARDGHLQLWAVSEHVERAGVHSGDATLLFPAQSLPAGVLARAREIGAALASALHITGPFNVQLLVKGSGVKVIECNLRASRSMPFVSKTLGINFIREAVRAMVGADPSPALADAAFEPQGVAVKAPQFSFDRLRGALPRLGVDMASTGEVVGFGATRDEALLKAMLSAGFVRPTKGALLAFDGTTEPLRLVDLASTLKGLGLRVFALPATAERLSSVEIEEVRLDDGTAAATLRDRHVDVVFSASAGAVRASAPATLPLERLAIDLAIPVVSEPVLATSVIAALKSTSADALAVRPWKDYLPVAAPRPGTAASAGAVGPRRAVRVFIRQPLTQSSAADAAMVQSVFDVLHDLDGADYHLDLLGAVRAETADSFREHFTIDTGLPFSPKAFRRARLDTLREADAMIVIRTGLSESGAFEVAYNIFGGRRVPILFAVWNEAPIKTTLLQDLDDLVNVRYVRFNSADDLRAPLARFLDEVVRGISPAEPPEGRGAPRASVGA